MILKDVFDLLEMSCKEINMEYKDVSMCELGDQRMKWNRWKTGKRYFEAQGIKEHISMDLNGRRGALRVNLSEIVDRWKNHFDIVTDYGTSEHVRGIYECFCNIHNFTREGGVMIHTVPISGGWIGHSPYHFKDWFFVKLAEETGYKSVLNEVRALPSRGKKVNSLVCSVLIKESDNLFISKEDFININGINGLK